MQNFVIKKTKIICFVSVIELDKGLQSKGLPASGLTKENFTFKLVPIGIDDSNKEMYRKSKAVKRLVGEINI